MANVRAPKHANVTPKQQQQQQQWQQWWCVKSEGVSASHHRTTTAVQRAGVEAAAQQTMQQQQHYVRTQLHLMLSDTRTHRSLNNTVVCLTATAAAGCVCVCACKRALAKSMLQPKQATVILTQASKPQEMKSTCKCCHPPDK
jgi:hypothetical protein